MSKNRVDEVVYDIVKAVREVMARHDVTYEEYRSAVGFLMGYADAAPFEIPLSCDLWFNATVHDIEMKSRQGSTTALEGPYFKEEVPLVRDSLKVLEGQGEPMIIRGKVTDLQGRPVEGAELYIWHSDPDGFYSGFCDYMEDLAYYRGRLKIGADGTYAVRTSVPAPYTIPHDGPTGRLLEMMGRHPWRPAHVHFRVRAKGFLEHITQAYFDGGDYVDSDCVEGVRPPLIHALGNEQGVRVLQKDFVLDPR
ncbi:dioxygenase [Marinibaculum pumilum]|uniref:Dioxygenase n=1 Tax=Marinibaculum pumilum TaxID=1766165 RepID=A0ABV7L6B4_9PROT